MSTGKRLAKRSIVGTRVAAPGDDGKYYAGVIQAVKTPASAPEANNCINLTPDTRYTVRFDSKAAVGKRLSREFHDAQLVGPGFRALAGLRLLPGQRLYLTHHGREVRADLLRHDAERDELRVLVHAPGAETAPELTKRLEEVRLLESRKSARLADCATDFARLADVASDRRRASHTIDVPHHPAVADANAASRKRRGGEVEAEGGDDEELMDECNAALVLMSLSCSPLSGSPGACAWGGRGSASPPASDSSASCGSWRSATPSPPPHSSSFSDEGIAVDFSPSDKVCGGGGGGGEEGGGGGAVVFECTWPGCGVSSAACALIESHIRNTHLGFAGASGEREEEFYYRERELHYTSENTCAPAPTLSHRDMCRPPHEDPDYQRRLVGSYRQGLLSALYALPPAADSWPPPHSPKQMRLTVWGGSVGGGGSGGGGGRRARSDNKKCRKVYGMEHREHWCTQCKWKKACTRFGD